MKKYIIMAAAAILALTACGNKKASAKQDNASEQTKASLVASTEEGAMFTDFEAVQPDGSVAKLSDYVGKGKYILVDFWASWCGPCRILSPTVDEIARELEGEVTVAKCNVDDCEEIAGDYGIRSIPTLLFFKNGEMVDRTVGAMPKAALVEKIESLL